MSHKILAIIQLCKSKLALKLNKPEMWILELTKVFIHEFHYDYIKNKYYNKTTLLLTDTDSLLYSNYSTKSKYDDESKKNSHRKMKDETGGVAIEEFVVLKPKMYSFLVGNNKHKKI